MRGRFFVVLVAILFTSCTTTIIWAPKNVEFEGDENKIELKGSDLKETDIKPTSEGNADIEVPLTNKAINTERQSATASFTPWVCGGSPANVRKF